MNRKQYDKENKELTFFKPEKGTLKLPFISEGISAGFPSPAADFKRERIILEDEIIHNPEATYYAKVRGDSMIGAGLEHGDILVIDKSITPEDHKIAVCFVDGEFTVKRLKIENDCVYLMPENDSYQPIKVTSNQSLMIWGIVTYVIKKV